MTVHGMHREASIDIQASPEAVYDLISNLPRMGQWSPENIGGEWQNGGSGKVGDRFLGHNRAGERAWSVPVMVTVAERGRCFEFVTHPDDGPYVRWTYRLEPSGAGTQVTEIWDVEQLSPGRRGQSQDQLDERSRYTEGAAIFALAAAYGIAKLLEVHDREVYAFGHVLSGHTLKHLVAAMGVYLLLLSLRRRERR